MSDQQVTGVDYIEEPLKEAPVTVLVRYASAPDREVKYDVFWSVSVAWRAELDSKTRWSIGSLSGETKQGFVDIDLAEAAQVLFKPPAPLRDMWVKAVLDLRASRPIMKDAVDEDADEKPARGDIGRSIGSNCLSAWRNLVRLLPGRTWVQA